MAVLAVWPMKLGWVMHTFDWRTEQPISLKQAAQMFPLQGGGKTISPQTVKNWILLGVKKSGRKRAGETRVPVFLEGIYVGNRLCTSRASLERFVARVSASETGKTPEPQVSGDVHPNSAKVSRHDESMASLRAAGYLS